MQRLAIFLGVRSHRFCFTLTLIPPVFRLSPEAFVTSYNTLCERHPRNLALRQAGLKVIMDANAKEVWGRGRSGRGSRGVGNACTCA